MPLVSLVNPGLPKGTVLSVRSIRYAKTVIEDRSFRCECCGLHMDRDANAAKNIAISGLKVQLVGARLPRSCGGQCVYPETGDEGLKKARTGLNRPRTHKRASLVQHWYKRGFQVKDAVRSLLEGKDALERFKELLSKNPEKYVLMAETGEEFILDSEEQLLKLVKERRIKNCYFAHEPSKKIRYSVY